MLAFFLSSCEFPFYLSRLGSTTSGFANGGLLITKACDHEHVYIYMCVYIYIYICICICIYIYKSKEIETRIKNNIPKYVKLYLHVCMYVCMYVCAHICMYVLYMYRCTELQLRLLLAADSDAEAEGWRDAIQATPGLPYRLLQGLGLKG